MNDVTQEAGHLALATDLTVAWLSNPNTKAMPEDVPAFLRAVHSAAVKLSNPQADDEAPTEEHLPAVSVRKSLASKDHLISLIDGKAYKSLKRHLGSHGLTPQQYRERYGLKPDYPMVAENHAELRRGLAKKIGLGRKPGAVAAPEAPKPVAAKVAATEAAAAKPARSAKKAAAPVKQAPAAPVGAAEANAPVKPEPQSAAKARSRSAPNSAKTAPAETAPVAEPDVLAPAFPASEPQAAPTD